MTQYTLWADAVFTKPVEGWPASGLVGQSIMITNGGSSADNSAKIVLQYKGMTPDGKDDLVGYFLMAVLEEKIDNIWVPLAAQFDTVKGTDEAENQMIMLSPSYNFDEGTPIKQFLGNREVSSLSKTQGSLGQYLRVSIYREISDPSRPDLDSLTISGVMRTYRE